MSPSNFYISPFLFCRFFLVFFCFSAETLRTIVCWYRFTNRQNKNGIQRVWFEMKWHQEEWVIMFWVDLNFNACRFVVQYYIYCTKLYWCICTANVLSHCHKPSGRLCAHTNPLWDIGWLYPFPMHTRISV